MTEPFAIAKDMHSRPMIAIQNLRKVYPSRGTTVTALDGINLSIEPGDIFGIIGMSGAGKSTLVRCINLLEKPTEGKILIDGQDIEALPNAELLKLRRSVSMIFQQFNLLMQRTAIKNVQFPLEIAGWKKAEAQKRALELLRLVGLEDKKDAYPSQLSGGQKQRVAIARALATGPKVLLSDEATSALDPVTTRSILELLRKINREMGITIVVITHQMNVIREICTHVAVIDDSRIVEAGTVEQVLSNPDNSLTKKLFESFEFEGGSTEAFRRFRIWPNGQAGELFTGITKAFGGAVRVLPPEEGSEEGASLLLETPADEPAVFRMCAYLGEQDIRFEEVGNGAEA